MCRSDAAPDLAQNSYRAAKSWSLELVYMFLLSYLDRLYVHSPALLSIT